MFVRVFTRHLAELCLVLAAISAAWLPASTRASNPNPIGITVSPVTQDFTIDAGATVTKSIKVTNPTAATLTFYPVVLNFTSSIEGGGRPEFYSSAQRSTRYSLSEWITPAVSSLSVTPLESKELNYNISVPDNGEPGGHYGAILLTTEPPKDNSDNSQVSVVGLVGTLILVTVPGDTTISGSISSFEAPSFLIKPPANFSVTVTNSGNLHFYPTGDIKIRNWSGNAVITLPVNSTKGAVLPDSGRAFTANWNFSWKSFGRYTATATLTYGSPEKEMTSTKVFYIIPLWLIILIVCVLLAILWFMARVRRSRSKTDSVSPPTDSRPFLR